MCFFQCLLLLVVGLYSATDALDITNPRIVNVYNGGIDIAWDAVENATKYQAILSEELKIVTSRRVDITEAKASYDEIKHDVGYVLMVTVNEMNGESYSIPAIKLPVFFKFNISSNATRPSRPTIEKLLKGKATLTSIEISWSAYPNATRYQVAYTVEGNTTETRVTTDKTKLTINGLKDGTSYTFNVAVIQTTNGTLTFPVRSQSIKIATARKIENFSILNVCGDSVVVVWDIFSNVGKYNVSLLDESNKIVALREVSTNYRVFKELEPTIYKVKVDSSNPNGEFSSEMLVFTVPNKSASIVEKASVMSIVVGLIISMQIFKMI